MAPNKRKIAAQRKVLEAFLNEEEDLSTGDQDIEVIENFSNFDEDHLRKVKEIADRLSDKPLDEVIQILSRLPKTTRNGLFTTTVMRLVFAKNKESADCDFTPLHQTSPEMFFSEESLTHHNPKNDEVKNYDIVNDLYKELKLAWFREDVTLNEHHYYWHVIYPVEQQPQFDRQGELFVYMHQQMLARYDFERLAMGFDRVHPFGPRYNWHDPIKEGYNCRLKGMSFRCTNSTILPVTKSKQGNKTKVYTTDKMVRQRDRIFDSILDGYYQQLNGQKAPLTMAALGTMVEANANLGEDGTLPDRSLYGNVHNIGHGIIGAINDPEGLHDIPRGPMNNTATAVRDPIFFRWHKYIDGICEEFRAQQEPYTAQDLKFHGIQIKNLETHITDTLGIEDQIEKVNQLHTYFEEKSYEVHRFPKDVMKPKRKKKTIEVLKWELNHLPFKFKLKMVNNNRKPALVALRIFLAPSTTAPLDEWRNMYVELDRFVVTVPPGGKDVERFNYQSSVVLDRYITIEEIEKLLACSEDSDDADEKRKGICGCGWPLHLLIPRGTEANMSAKLFVIATDWSEDRHDSNATLDGSVSYCGKSGLPYPDKKPMGYPFDRAMDYASIEKLVKHVPNSFVTEIKIRHRPHFHGNTSN